MNIAPVNLNKINFTAYSGKSVVTSDKNPYVGDCRNHYTSFMRNFPTLEFTRDYIVDTFPNGTHIAEFGCSQGQKPYSLLIMLDKYNSDKKYTITGYDNKAIIDSAKKGIYKIDGYNSYEKTLFDGPNELRQNFNKYFDTIEGDSYFQSVTPNTEKTKGLIKFKEGDIRDIDKILKSKKSGVVIFQNALYHVLDNDSRDRKNTRTLIQKVYNVLPQKGIFVIGSLPSDHLYSEYNEKDTFLKYQDNERIRVYEGSMVHDYLREAGFKPVFYEKMPNGKHFDKYNNVYLPSVWQKG